MCGTCPGIPIHKIPNVVYQLQNNTQDPQAMSASSPIDYTAICEKIRNYLVRHLPNLTVPTVAICEHHKPKIVLMEEDSRVIAIPTAFLHHRDNVKLGDNTLLTILRAVRVLLRPEPFIISDDDSPDLEVESVAPPTDDPIVISDDSSDDESTGVEPAPMSIPMESESESESESEPEFESAPIPMESEPAPTPTEPEPESEPAPTPTEPEPEPEPAPTPTEPEPEPAPMEVEPAPPTEPVSALADFGEFKSFISEERQRLAPPPPQFPLGLNAREHMPPPPPLPRTVEMPPIVPDTPEMYPAQEPTMDPFNHLMSFAVAATPVPPTPPTTSDKMTMMTACPPVPFEFEQKGDADLDINVDFSELELEGIDLGEFTSLLAEK